MIENINFFCTPSCLIERRKIKSFIVKKIIQKRCHPFVLNFYFWNKKEHLKINQSILQHNYYTDIITIPASIKNNVGGEIYINIDQVRENAKIYKCSIREEILRVVFHGILHLIGQDDRTEMQYKEMKRKENQWIKEFREYVV